LASHLVKVVVSFGYTYASDVKLAYDTDRKLIAVLVNDEFMYV
jgi:hypothetical protein